MCGIVHTLSWEGVLKPLPYIRVASYVAVHSTHALNMHVHMFTIINKYGLPWAKGTI